MAGKRKVSVAAAARPAKQAKKEPAPKAAVKRKEPEEEEEGLRPVAHPSHGKAKEEPAPKAAAKRKEPEKEEEGLRPVAHPSHGKTAGGIWVFGDGDMGQLGLGEDITSRTRAYPLTIPGKNNKVLQVACGGMHTVAVTEDGSVWTWGVNDEGALGRETEGKAWEESELRSKEPGVSTEPDKAKLPAEVGEIVQVAAGDSHTVALTSLGAVYGWGTYRDGSGVFGFSPKQRIALLPTEVYSPRNADDQIVKIASGADHTMALTASGAVLTWGSGQQGQLGRVGERITERQRMGTLLQPGKIPVKRRRNVSVKFIDVACGTYTSFAITADHHVVAWGLNNYGQLGIGGEAPAFAPLLVPALKGAQVIRGGQHHTLALLEDSTVMSFGRPTYGRLGRADVDVNADVPMPVPTAVDNLDDIKVTGLAAGLAVSGCFDEEGSAWLWGFNTNSQLAKGDADDDDEAVPLKLGITKRFKGQKVVQLEFGGQHAAMLCLPGPPIPADSTAATPAPAQPAEPANGVPAEGGAAVEAGAEGSGEAGADAGKEEDAGGMEEDAGGEGEEEEGQEGSGSEGGDAEMGDGEEEGEDGDD